MVYRAKVDPSSGPVRLTSTVGGRDPHATAVGKLVDSVEDIRRNLGPLGATS